MPEISLCVMGGGAVGKSCITIQFIQNIFVEGHNGTIEDVFRKPVSIDGVTSILNVTDTAGQEAFASMRTDYYKTSQGFVFVYSITDLESFHQMKTLHSQMRKFRAKDPHVPCVIVGNKADLSSVRAVAKDEGQVFARQANCPWMEITAKNKEQVEDVFACVVRQVRNGSWSEAPPPVVVRRQEIDQPAPQLREDVTDERKQLGHDAPVTEEELKRRRKEEKKKKEEEDGGFFSRIKCAMI